jgi:paraquat-inducible protein B
VSAATTNHWKLGLFVVLGFATALGGLLWVGQRQFRRESFRTVTYFDEAVQGLAIGGMVQFRGSPVGQVAAISVAPDRRHVEVESDISVDALKRFGLRQRDIAAAEDGYVMGDLRMQLVAAGLTGAKLIQVDFFDPKKYPPEKLSWVPPINYIPSVPSTLRSVEEAVLEAVNYVPEIAGKVSALLDKLDRAIDAIDAPAVARQARATLETADRDLRAIESAGVATRTAAALDEARETLATVRRIGNDVAADRGPLYAALGRVESAAGALEKAIQDASVASTASTIRTTAATFGETGRNLNELDAEVRTDLVAFREAMERLRDLADLLERDPSSLLHGKSPDTSAAQPAGGRP